MNKASNIITIKGQPAAVTFEADINAFRGKFLNVNGYCDFVATSIEALYREGESALRFTLALLAGQGGQTLLNLVQGPFQTLPAQPFKAILGHMHQAVVVQVGIHAQDVADHGAALIVGLALHERRGAFARQQPLA